MDEALKHRRLEVCVPDKYGGLFWVSGIESHVVALLVVVPGADLIANVQANQAPRSNEGTALNEQIVSI
jgi:hypothetical protein